MSACNHKNKRSAKEALTVDPSFSHLQSCYSVVPATAVANLEEIQTSWLLQLDQRLVPADRMASVLMLPRMLLLLLLHSPQLFAPVFVAVVVVV